MKITDSKGFLVAIFLISLVCPQSIKAQDPSYTQLSNAPVYFNPAFTGLHEGLNIRLCTRSQGFSTATTWRSYCLSGDVAIRNLYGLSGLGIIFNSDNEGLGFINNYNLGLLTSIRVPLSEYISGQLGFKAVWFHKSIAWDEFRMSEQVTQRYGNIYDSGYVYPAASSLNNPDFAVGVVVHFTNREKCRSGTIGIAADHLFEPDQSFIDSEQSPLQRKWTAHADVVWAFKCGSGARMSGKIFKINPGIVFQHQQSMNILIAGANITKSGLYGGLWYKGSFGADAYDAISVLAGYRYVFAENISIKFSYCYDKLVSVQPAGSSGAHEIGLVLEFGEIGNSTKSKRQTGSQSKDLQYRGIF